MTDFAPLVGVSTAATTAKEPSRRHFEQLSDDIEREMDTPAYRHASPREQAERLAPLRARLTRARDEILEASRRRVARANELYRQGGTVEAEAARHLRRDPRRVREVRDAARDAPASHLHHLARQLVDDGDNAGLVGLMQGAAGRQDAADVVATAAEHLREHLVGWRREMVRVQDAHAGIVAAVSPTDPRAILEAANEVGVIPRDDGTTEHLSPAEVADLLAEEPASIA